MDCTNDVDFQESIQQVMAAEKLWATRGADNDDCKSSIDLLIAKVVCDELARNGNYILERHFDESAYLRISETVTRDRLNLSLAFAYTLKHDGTGDNYCSYGTISIERD